MSRSKSIKAYPAWLYELAGQFQEDVNHEASFRHPARDAALSQRLDIYGFQHALRDDEAKKGGELDQYFRFLGVRAYVREGADGKWYLTLRHVDSKALQPQPVKSVPAAKRARRRK